MVRIHTSAPATGYTLIELLIVVVIISTLAAIAVPHFSTTTDDARKAAYESNRASLRAVVELYRQQHGVYPGHDPATAATCVNGTNITAPVGSDSFFAQLLNYSDLDNSVCTGFDADKFRYGPYFKDGIPDNPLGSANTVNVVKTGVLGLASAGTGGWRFDSITGELIGDH